MVAKVVESLAMRWPNSCRTLDRPHEQIMSEVSIKIKYLKLILCLEYCWYTVGIHTVTNILHGTVYCIALLSDKETCILTP